MRSEEHQEGIVLRSLDFKDREKIITVFTANRGLISLIVKGITKKRSHLLTLTSPFTQADYHYLIGRSSLYSFKEATPLNTHHYLREKLSHIQAATTFASALLSSQMPGKPAPHLYALTLSYLKQLPQFDTPSSLTASFLLKLLKHDGHLSLKNGCTSCGEPPTHLHVGEPFCRTHTPAYAHLLSQTEWDTLQVLAEARSFAPLKEIQVSPSLHQMIELIFKEKIKE